MDCNDCVHWICKAPADVCHAARNSCLNCTAGLWECELSFCEYYDYENGEPID